MSDTPSADIFTPHIGKAVSVADGQKLALVAVERPAKASSDAFSLLLRGAPHPIVPEGMNRLTFEGGASFDLYLIPIHTPSREHQDYQIVFN